MMPAAPRPFSVIIPAHNEANVIERCLAAILRDAPAGAMEVIVACNGCTDDTAQRATRISPDIRVIELDKGSKPLALNTGGAMAHYQPRLYVDADIVLDYHALAALAEALREPGVMAASPALHVDLDNCGPLIRAYYRVWLSQPYVTDNLVGSGVFGLSPAGQEVIAEFPPIIADDEFVRTRFAASQRRRVDADRRGKSVSFTIFPPRNVVSLIRIESRQRAGLADLRRRYPTSQASARMTSWQSLFAATRHACSPLDVLIYLGIKLAGRLHFRFARLRGLDNRWLRDESSRQS